MDNFEGKHIWIIGASSGIGCALAQELSRQGATLALSARSEDKLNTLKEELSGAHKVFPVDVTDLKKLKATADEIMGNFEKLDSVIYLAALYNPGPLYELDIEKTHMLVNVNLNGAFNLLHAILPHFKKHGKGQIALCGSVAGYRGLPKGQPYSATKAAIINLAESLKAEEPTLDIKLISPGFVKTDLTAKNDFDMPMMIEPEDAAKAIANGLLKKNFEIHFPKKFTFLMKILQILPAFLYFKIAKRMV